LRALTWIVAIVVAAVVVTLLAQRHAGYVLLVLPQHRIELSLNLALALLAGGFILAYSLVRLVAAAISLPRDVREYRLARRREKGWAALTAALREYFSGRFGRAEKSAAAALALAAEEELAAVIAARSAHELRAYEKRDDYFARAAGAGRGDPTLRLMSEAELLLAERRAREALEALRRLPRRHTAALRLELRAHQQLRNWAEVPALVEELRRRNVYDATQAAGIRAHAHAENLKRRAADEHALEEAWQKVPAAERVHPRVAATAARCYIARDRCEMARRIVEEALDAVWDSDLAALYAECRGGDALSRIERAEKWLGSQPRDAALLLTLGRLCAEQALWGKAQSYLEASLAIEPTRSAYLELARLHDTRGNAEASRDHYRKGLELALAQIGTASGGRRRALL
jgi:HemY protein